MIGTIVFISALIALHFHYKVQEEPRIVKAGHQYVIKADGKLLHLREPEERWFMDHTSYYADHALGTLEECQNAMRMLNGEQLPNEIVKLNARFPQFTIKSPTGYYLNQVYFKHGIQHWQRELTPECIYLN